MNLLDYIIIITMVYLIVKGIFRGFIREIASLAGIIIGIIVAYVYLPALSEFLKNYLPSSQFLPFVSFAVIFALILVIFNIIGWGLMKSLKKAFLGWFDKSLGACLAVFKGIILIYVALILLTFFLPSKTPLIAGSALAPWVTKSYQSMSKIISPDFYDHCKKKIVGEIRKLDEIHSEKIKDIKNKDGK